MGHNLNCAAFTDKYFRVVGILLLKKEGDISSLLPISNSSRHQSGLLLGEKYYIPKIGILPLQ